jgi:hypothetical protein
MTYDHIDDFKMYEVNELRGDSLKVILKFLDESSTNLNNIMVRAKILKELGIEKIVQTN